MAKIGDSQEAIFRAIVPFRNWKYGTPLQAGTTFGDQSYVGKRVLQSGEHPIRADDINELRDAFCNLAKMLSNDVSIGASGQVINPIRQSDLFVFSGTGAVENRTEEIGDDASILHTNISENYFRLYPPDGFSMANYVGGIASLRIVGFAGNIDWNDTLFCRMFVMYDRLDIICNNSENRSTAFVNYMTIWSPQYNRFTSM